MKTKKDITAELSDLKDRAIRLLGSGGISDIAKEAGTEIEELRRNTMNKWMYFTVKLPQNGKCIIFTDGQALAMGRFSRKIWDDKHRIQDAYSMQDIGKMNLTIDLPLRWMYPPKP